MARAGPNTTVNCNRRLESVTNSVRGFSSAQNVFTRLTSRTGRLTAAAGFLLVQTVPFAPADGGSRSRPWHKPRATVMNPNFSCAQSLVTRFDETHCCHHLIGDDARV